MPHIYSSTVQTDQLLTHVRQLCENPPVPHHGLDGVAHMSAASAGSVPGPKGTPSRWVLALREWRSRGYSWRWVVSQIPGTVPLYVLLRTLQDLPQTLATLQHQQHSAHKTAHNQHRHLEKQIQHLREQQEKLQRDNAHLRRRLLQAEKQSANQPQPATSDSAISPVINERIAQWYGAFEETQRGDVSHIAQRQAQYLALVAPVLQALSRAPALDLGCGRGEWVQLLANQGHPSSGVDSNPAMLQPARAAGADVHCADLFDYLAQQPTEHYALVTSFQVVEHLPLPLLLQLLQEAWRVLRPGGMIVLETPNPENLQVAAYSFWMDPTHQRPLPPPLLLQMAQHTGFVECHIHRSSPWPVEQQAPGLPQPLPKLLYAEQDYALIARKPMP